MPGLRPIDEIERRRATAAAFVHASPERWVQNNIDALKADVDAFVGVRRAAAAIRGQKACALAPFPDCSRLPEKRYLVLHGDVDPVVDAALEGSEPQAQPRYTSRPLPGHFPDTACLDRWRCHPRPHPLRSENVRER